MISQARLVQAEHEILTQFEHESFLSLPQILRKVHCPESEVYLGLQELVSEGILTVYQPENEIIPPSSGQIFEKKQS